MNRINNAMSIVFNIKGKVLVVIILVVLEIIVVILLVMTTFSLLGKYNRKYKQDFIQSLQY